MKSPFPGLDPYLEARWGDVHQSLITYTRDTLQPNLPEDLRARVEERVFVETEAEQRSSMRRARYSEPLFVQSDWGRLDHSKSASAAHETH